MQRDANERKCEVRLIAWKMRVSWSSPMSASQFFETRVTNSLRCVALTHARLNGSVIALLPHAVLFFRGVPKLD
jgi:hypothetical protein